jgi:hypothetical protein
MKRSSFYGICYLGWVAVVTFHSIRTSHRILPSSKWHHQWTGRLCHRLALVRKRARHRAGLAVEHFEFAPQCLASEAKLMLATSGSRRQGAGERDIGCSNTWTRRRTLMSVLGFVQLPKVSTAGLGIWTGCDRASRLRAARKGARLFH